jgi:hypothetical protein
VGFKNGKVVGKQWQGWNEDVNRAARKQPERMDLKTGSLKFRPI